MSLNNNITSAQNTVKSNPRNELQHAEQTFQSDLVQGRTDDKQWEWGAWGGRGEKAMGKVWRQSLKLQVAEPHEWDRKWDLLGQMC